MEILLEVYDVDATPQKIEVSKNLALAIYQMNKSGIVAKFHNGGFCNKYFDDRNPGFRLVVNKQHVLNDPNFFGLKRQVIRDDDIAPIKDSILNALQGYPCNFRFQYAQN
jgi:hypothetical protein